MLNDLEKIREALDEWIGHTYLCEMSLELCGQVDRAKEARKALNSLIERLNQATPTFTQEDVEKAAKGICVQRLKAEGDYPDRQPTDPTSDWYRKEPENPQEIWELHIEEAKAALNAIGKIE